MFKDIKFTQINQLDQYLLIDVRSPSEYLEATIPNAVNIPLFDDEERALVGTSYKEQGKVTATYLGLDIVSPKIPKLMKEIEKALKPEQKPIFFCWRGGMRSKTMATLFSLVYPFEVYRLEGGYRGYREYIVEEINSIELKMPTFVLHGMTGVGKTTLLHKLLSKNIPVIDLEGLAGHRGSIFGGIGDVNPVNQKIFDSRMYEVLQEIKTKDAIVLEAESKRIGKVSLPENVITAKENGIHIIVTASMDKRIERIIEEYKPLENKDSLFDAFTRVSRRLPTEIRKEMDTAFSNDDFYTVVKLFLIYYYDPKYQYSTDQYKGPFHEINSDNLETAVDEIIKFINSKISKTESLLV